MADLLSRISTLLKEEHEWAAETKLTGMWDDAAALKSYLEDLYEDYKEMYELKHMGEDAEELQDDIETVEARVIELGETLPGRESEEGEREAAAFDKSADMYSSGNVEEGIIKESENPFGKNLKLIDRYIDLGISSLAKYNDSVDKIMDHLISTGDDLMSDADWDDVESELRNYKDEILKSENLQVRSKTVRKLKESEEVVDFGLVRDLVLKVEEVGDIYKIVTAKIQEKDLKTDLPVIEKIVKDTVSEVLKTLAEDPLFEKDKFSKSVVDKAIDSLVKIAYNRDVVGQKLFVQASQAETVELNSSQEGTAATKDILNQDKIKLEPIKDEKEVKSDFAYFKEEIISSKLNLLYEAPESIADIRNEAKNLKVYAFEIKRNLGPQKIGNYTRIGYADEYINKYVMKKLWHLQDMDESQKKFNAKYRETLQALNGGKVLFTGTPFGLFIVRDINTLGGKTLEWKGGTEYYLEGKPLEVLQ